MSKQTNNVQDTFDKVFNSVMELARKRVLTGEPLAKLEKVLGDHQAAINELKQSCGEPPMFQKG